METPEVHHPHPGHGGGLPRWLELVIAVTALITSISSIAIAVHHGHIMEKLVQANSIPYMQAGFSDRTSDGREVLSLDLLNRGVGPAHEKSLKVKVDGHYVHSTRELILASLGPERGAQAYAALDPIKNGVRTRFVPGGQSQLVFYATKTAQNADAWKALDNEQNRWEVSLCFCSVFEDCWLVRDKWHEPAPVKQCVRDEPNEFLP